MVGLCLRLRWFVLNVLIALLGAGILTACYPTVISPNVDQIPSATSIQISDTPTKTDSPTPSETPTLSPTLTDTPIPSPTTTLSPTPACFRLLNPPEGSRIAELGIVKFEWEAHSAAQKYLLEITVPDGHMLAFDTFNTSVEQYLTTLPWEGVYSWRVAALNANGGVLCIAEPFSFSKPKFQPSLTPETYLPPPSNSGESNGVGG